MKKLLGLLLGIFLLLLLPYILSIPGIGTTIFSRKNFKINSLSLSWLGPQKLKAIYKKQKILAHYSSIEIDTPFLKLLHYKSKPIAFSLERASYNGYELQESTGKIHFTKDKKEISINGLYKAPEKKAFSLYALLEKDHYELQGKELPTGLIDPIFKKNYHLEEILGPYLNINLSSSSTISLDFSSEAAQGGFLGKVEGDFFTLKEPATFVIRLTPYLSKELLKYISPLLLTGIEAKKPLVLRIFPKGFALPIKDFSIERLSVGQAFLDLGKIKAGAENSLSSILEIFKIKQAKEIAIWFAPFDLQIEKGILKVSRIDALLADSLPVCTFGEVDLLSKNIRMHLAIFGSALNKAFKLNLKKDSAIVIPIKGTIDHPKMETKKAAKKIAALLAAKTFVPAGPLKDLLGVPKLNDEKIPPLKYPRPWE